MGCYRWLKRTGQAYVARSGLGEWWGWCGDRWLKRTGWAYVARSGLGPRGAMHLLDSARVAERRKMTEALSIPIENSP